MANQFVTLIDGLLAQPKVLAGTPSWQQSTRDGHFCWSAMLETQDGLPTNLKLIVDANPTWTDRPFSIHLVFERLPLWRVEMAQRASHMNRTALAGRVAQGLVYGPHQHPWDLNKHLCRPHSPPELLKFAVPMPANIRSLDNSVRWFCGETRINIDFEIPEYPKPGLLSV